MPFHIVCLVTPQSALSTVSGITDTFAIANLFARQMGRPDPFTCTVVTPDGAPITASGGVRLIPHAAMHTVPMADLLILPAFVGDLRPRLREIEEVTRWIQDWYQAGGTIAAVCTGAFLLAETGLLDQKKATTNWLYARLFRKRYPHVLLDEDAMFIQDDRLYTSGASTAWLHLTMQIIEEVAGPEVSRHTGSVLLLDPNRDSQAPYRIPLPDKHHGDGAILRVQEWLDRHLGDPVIVEEMAQEAGLSERQFIRRFKAATGTTPIRYLQEIRIAKARTLLETTSESIAEITWSVGYEDVNSFRKLFRKHTGLSPNAYREKFRRSASA